MILPVPECGSFRRFCATLAVSQLRYADANAALQRLYFSDGRAKPIFVHEIKETEMAETGLPLEGVRVIEMTHMVMGPTCGMILAQLGAEVIKVEPPAGDKSAFDRHRPQGLSVRSL
jgi:hypothetical protein